jgi:DNA polymerase
MEAAEILKEVAGQVSICTRCKLHHSRKRAVPGEGPAKVDVMFIGEGPGFYENEQGRPFVGAAGKFLDELLERAGLKRSEVFITNVVKCRPPSNRDPEPDELEACADYLNRQIEVLDPLVIVTLGRFSMARYFPAARITSVHGKPGWVGSRLIVPMFHPAAALHQPSLKSAVLEDFSRLGAHVQKARQSRAPQPAPKVEPVVAAPAESPAGSEATQLSLF